MENKKSFIKGAVSGILAVLVIAVVVIGGGVYYGVIKVDMYGVSGSTDGTFSSDMSSKTNYIKSLIDKYFLDDIDEEAMEDYMYAGMLASLGDPYTVYYNKEAYTSLIESNEGVYCGIGVVVQQNPETLEITVSYPYEDGPGAEAGIQAGDILYSIDGTQITDYDVNDVVAMIRGEEGTTVEIGVLRQGVNGVVTMQVERRKIETHTVKHSIIDGNTGYVKITQFEKVTPSQLKTAMDDLMASGIDSLIIDLRDNPGGDLDSVMDCMDMFLPKGLYTYLEDKYGNRQEYNGKKNADYDVDAVILVNGSSASASELFTGAMRAYDRAEIVGTTTFGKGIVQQLFPLTDGSGVKLTMAKYYTPDGICIHKTGITPDYEVGLDEGEYASSVSEEDDEQLQKALEVLGKK